MHKRRVEKSENSHASAQAILPPMRPWWMFRSVQCRLALPIDQSSLVSNIRAKLEPCNLQSFEIDQGIERSDGQSWKGRREDEPTHAKKEHRHQIRRKKASTISFSMRLGLGLSLYLFLLKNELEAASSTVHFFALLKGNKLSMTIAFVLAFFLSRAEFYVVSSSNAQLDKWKRQSDSLPCSPLETSYLRCKHPLSEHECITATCLEPLGFLFS